MKLKSKKGGALLEASLIYPVIFFAMIAVICVTICMYMASITKAGLNMELKAKNLSDNEIGDMVLENSKKLADDKYSSSVFMRGTDIQKDKIKGEDVLRAFRMKTYRSYGIGIFDMARNHSSRIYDIDEEKYIRRLDMVLK